MKRVKLINLILKILIALSGVAMLVAWLIDGETWFKPMSYLATIVVPFGPDILYFLFKIKPSDKLVAAYEIFLIFAMVAGIDFDLYRTFLVQPDGTSYFDKIVHCASGVLTSFLGKEILDGCYEGKRVKKSEIKYNPWFALLVIMGTTALVACLWECFEFSYDLITGGHMQELVSNGVADTMWDIIVALVGGLVAGIFLMRTPKKLRK